MFVLPLQAKWKGTLQNMEGDLLPKREAVWKPATECV